MHEPNRNVTYFLLFSAFTGALLKTSPCSDWWIITNCCYLTRSWQTNSQYSHNSSWWKWAFIFLIKICSTCGWKPSCCFLRRLCFEHWMFLYTLKTEMLHSLLHCVWLGDWCQCSSSHESGLWIQTEITREQDCSSGHFLHKTLSSPFVFRVCSVTPRCHPLPFNHQPHPALTTPLSPWAVARQPSPCIIHLPAACKYVDN